MTNPEIRSLNGCMLKDETARNQNAQLTEDINSITTVTDMYNVPVDAVATIAGYRAYGTTSNGRVGFGADSTKSVKIYPIEKDKKYRVYGHGYDRDTHHMAVIGDVLNVNDDTVCNLLGFIEAGTDAYPNGFTYHVVDFTAENDGYLYVNYLTDEDEATLKTTSRVVSIGKNVALNEGVYISNGVYYHFKPTGGRMIIRQFNRRGVNNLFQWTGLFLGHVGPEGVTIEKIIGNYSTDIVGPISIWNGTLFPNNYGEWSGGNHGFTVNSVNCATAKQRSLTVTVNGNAVSEDGLYYGAVHFRVENELYFPQSITSDTLDDATLAIVEHRDYWLADTMKVNVRLDFMEDTRISLYYGMQFVTVGFDRINLYNNSYSGLLSAVTEEIKTQEKERLITLDNDSVELSMHLHNVGLGTYAANDGIKNGFANIPKQSSNQKVYYVLVSNNVSHLTANQGTCLMWSGEYNVKLN